MPEDKNQAQTKEKILIIEDEQSLLDLLSAKLKKEGYTVDFATDGEEGLKKIEEFKPDLILLDIVMPKIDGYEVLETLHSQNSKTPVIIISNSGQPVEIEKTKKLGAVDHLIKTEFSPLDVLNKVRDYLDSGSAEGEGERPREKKKAEPRAKKSEGKDVGIKVVLVEDDPFLREICSKKLTKEGYTVYEAIDGEQAMENITQVKPDIILLDIILPAVDGFQILHQIRTNEDAKVAKTPVIMLSNLGQDDDIKKAKDMGADDYLVKVHFTTEEIIGKINSILQGKKSE
jgi:DNA-binding response OmpR family regulator